MNTVLKKTEENELKTITEISKAAFDSDITVGNSEVGGPPFYDKTEWHRKMMEGNHLFTFTVNGDIIGGAVLFKDNVTLYISRIFISPDKMGNGYGIALMNEIEKLYGEIKYYKLDTPIWNSRTNNFYKKCGYSEILRDKESVFYQKITNHIYC